MASLTGGTRLGESLFRSGHRVHMDALLVRVRRAVDGDMVAVKALDRFRVIDAPDSLLLLVDKNRRHAAFDAFLHAGGSGAGVLCPAHAVGDPAIDGGRVSRTRRD